MTANTKLNYEKMNIEDLSKKPVAMMTGEELGFLIESRMEAWMTKAARQEQKQVFHGIHGIAQLFGCSEATANRIKKSGIIDGAITQIGRSIIIDGTLALKLAKNANIERRSHVKFLK